MVFDFQTISAPSSPLSRKPPMIPSSNNESTICSVTEYKAVRRVRTRSEHSNNSTADEECAHGKVIKKTHAR